MTECLFVDDGALLATTRSGTERVYIVQTYQKVSRNFGLSVTTPKTKYMVTGPDSLCKAVRVTSRHQQPD